MDNSFSGEPIGWAGTATGSVQARRAPWRHRKNSKPSISVIWGRSIAYDWKNLIHRAIQKALEDIKSSKAFSF
jgi:hypothetical protein